MKSRSVRSGAIARLAGALVAIAALAGCATLPPNRIADREAAPAAPLAMDADGTHASTTLDVMSFNIEGLGWPARKGRAPSLKRIASIIAAMQARGEGPDVILLQEAFSPAAIRAVQDMGFPNIAWGPRRTQRKAMARGTRMSKPFLFKKGEVSFHLVGSGLAILSRYPIIQTQSEPFGRRRCAGFDCLSNKGMIHARIAMPGVPEAIDLFDTHLNSQRASGVVPARHREAHRIQVGQLADFIVRYADPTIPAVLGGDFNMKHSAVRFEWFQDVQPFALVHQYCLQHRQACDIRMSWDGDEPWMDTQDLQLFAPGRRVEMWPERVEALFDGTPASPQLSDHDAFRVVYRLRWKRGDGSAPADDKAGKSPS